MIKNRKRGEPYRLFWVECAISLNQAQGARNRDFAEKIKITNKTFKTPTTGLFNFNFRFFAKQDHLPYIKYITKTHIFMIIYEMVM